MMERDFGQRTGLRIPRTNIGAMRLPADQAEAVALIRHAIDSGMRYIDTSRGYGDSEWLLGRALRDGYREKVILSTKCSPFATRSWGKDSDGSAETTRRKIEESLLRLDVDCLDFYQVWNIGSREQWDEITRPGGMLDGVLKARDDGLIRHTGVTGHDSVENFLDYLDSDWIEVILVSYNMLSRTYAPVLEKAHRNGVGTLVMNPVGGGKLVEDSPVLDELVAEMGAVSLPDLAVRYVLANPHVDTLLCGMTKRSDVDDTIASAERGPLSAEQVARVEEFVAARSRESVGFCTACEYCMPCPQGINIPRVMSAIYFDRFLGLKRAARNAYAWGGEPKADACVRCGQCEPKCTQHLKIMDEMAYAASAFGPDQAETNAG